MIESDEPHRRPGPLGWLLLTPLTAWLLLLVVAPTLVLIAYSFAHTGPLGQVAFTDEHARLNLSFKNYRAIASPSQWLALTTTAACGLAAYGATKRRTRHALPIAVLITWLLLCAYVFTRTDNTPVYLKIFVISVNYAAASTAVCVLAGYPVAYFIGRAPARWRGLLLIGVMIPFWTSFLVRTYAWVTIFRGNGLLNAVLAAVGLGPVDLYPGTTAVMVGLVYTYLPFMILPIFTSIERLDGALIDAALDLGASPWRAFREVILPLTRPGLVAGVLLTFVPAVGQFAINHILGGGQDVLLGNLIERQFTVGRDPPLGAALGVLLLAVFAVTYFLSTRQVRRQVTRPRSRHSAHRV